MHASLILIMLKYHGLWFPLVCLFRAPFPLRVVLLIVCCNLCVALAAGLMNACMLLWGCHAFPVPFRGGGDNKSMPSFLCVFRHKCGSSNWWCCYAFIFIIVPFCLSSRCAILLNLSSFILFVFVLSAVAAIAPLAGPYDTLAQYLGTFTVTTPIPAFVSIITSTLMEGPSSIGPFG